MINQFDPKTDVVLPKVMFEKLCWLNWKLNNIQIVLEWLTKNPQCKKEFIDIFRQFDEKGFTSFCWSTNYYVDLKKRDINVLTLAKRALKHQDESIKRANFRDQLAHTGPITFTMANGLTCTLKRDHVYGSTMYWAIITCTDAQVHLKLNLRQITAFQKTADNINLLKRIRPDYIVYEAKGERHTLDSKLNQAVLNAVMNGDPVAVAPLLA